MPINNVSLALGTNLGDRPENLAAAIAALPPAMTVLEQSFVYETLPWGVTDQPSFLKYGDFRQNTSKGLRNF